MRILKQNTAVNIMVFMTDSADHVTGEEGLTLTVSISKDGGAFNVITPDVTERGSGWYNIALTTADVNTLGDLAIHITASGADNTDLIARVSGIEADIATILSDGTDLISQVTGIETNITTILSSLSDIDMAVIVIGKLTGNKVTKAGDVITIYEEDGVTVWREYDLALGGRRLIV